MPNRFWEIERRRTIPRELRSVAAHLQQGVQGCCADASIQYTVSSAFWNWVLAAVQRPGKGGADIRE